MALEKVTPPEEDGFVPFSSPLARRVAALKAAMESKRMSNSLAFREREARLLEMPGSEISPETERLIERLHSHRDRLEAFIRDAKEIYAEVFPDSSGRYYCDSLEDQLTTIDATIEEVRGTDNRGYPS